MGGDERFEQIKETNLPGVVLGISTKRMSERETDRNRGSIAIKVTAFCFLLVVIYSRAFSIFGSSLAIIFSLLSFFTLSPGFVQFGRKEKCFQDSF